jgi:dephospho-CoA kinase
MELVVIGIVGGVASGKSLVADCLRQLGATVLDADAAGHQVLRQAEVIAQLRQRWGGRILDDQGQVCRAAVAGIVFGPQPSAAQELASLERITHPRIGALLRQQIDHLRAAGTEPAMVLDAPVMIKAGWVRLCDRVLFVQAPRELRLQRARQRGWSEADFDAREAAQESLEVKRNHADWVIDNSGSPVETMEQVRRFWQSLD